MISAAPLDTMRVLPPAVSLNQLRESVKAENPGMSGQFRLNLFQMRYTAAAIVGGRLAHCGHTLINKDTGVTIVKTDEGRRYLSGVQTCGSVWACPVCSLKISTQRSIDVGRILRSFQTKLMPLGFLTLTWRHNHKEELKYVYHRGMKIYRKITKLRAFRNLEKKHGIEGMIRALEIKHGNNGWHPHLHIAIVGNSTEQDVEQFANEFIQIWCNELQDKANIDAQKYLPIKCEQGIADYITKWAAADEMVKGNSKAVGKKTGSVTPFVMLEQINSSVVSEEKKRFYKAKYREYTELTKGKKQLTIARRILELHKDILFENQEQYEEIKTDEEIVKQEQDGTVVLTIAPDVFTEIANNQIQGYVMNTHEDEGIDGVINLLMEFGVFCSYNEDTQVLFLTPD